MKKVITRNIPLKILSFLLAVLLWVVIMNIEDPFITATIEDIEVTKINTNILEEENKLYEVETGEFAKIKVRGKRSIIEKLKNTDFTAVADFNEMSLVKAVPIHIEPKPSAKYTSDDIEIMEQTQMMTISLEDADTQSFRVNVKTTGEIMEGYFVTDMVANPNVIEISGSKKQISNIKEVIVEVSIDGTSGSNQVIAKPKAIDENGYAVAEDKLKFQTNEITVSTTILPTKEIGILINTIGSPYYGYTCTKTQYDPLNITIAGEQKDLDQIGYITIPIDISLSKQTIVDTKNIEDYLDNKFTLVSDNNSVAITAVIEKQESKDMLLYSSFITVLNLDENLDALIQTPGTITAHVLGTKDSLTGITASSLQPYVDLKGYGPGTYSITLQFKEQADIEVKPITISIEIADKDI